MYKRRLKFATCRINGASDMVAAASPFRDVPGTLQQLWQLTPIVLEISPHPELVMICP